MIQNLANRNGHRNEKGGQTKRGGNNNNAICPREKKEQWVHPIICDAVAERKSAVVQKYSHVSSSKSEEESEESDVSVSGSFQ